MMAYWRAANDAENRQQAMDSIATHAATAAAIINTIAGKDAPEFKAMVDRLLGGEEEQETKATPQSLGGFGITPGPTQGLEGFKEF